MMVFVTGHTLESPQQPESPLGPEGLGRSEARP